jgi:hypothetical protein
MSFKNKVSELANYFSDNFEKVKELPTDSLAGAITKGATAIPTASSGLFTKSSVQDDPYPNMIATINDMLDTITESDPLLSGAISDKIKSKKVSDELKPTLRPEEISRGLIEKPKAFELNTIPREIFSKKGESYSLTDTDIDIMARTIAAEAQGESLKGQIGVGYVILKRYCN